MPRGLRKEKWKFKQIRWLFGSINAFIIFLSTDSPYDSKRFHRSFDSPLRSTGPRERQPMTYLHTLRRNIATAWKILEIFSGWDLVVDEKVLWGGNVNEWAIASLGSGAWKEEMNMKLIVFRQVQPGATPCIYIRSLESFCFSDDFFLSACPYLSFHFSRPFVFFSILLFLLPRYIFLSDFSTRLVAQFRPCRISSTTMDNEQRKVGWKSPCVKILFFRSASNVLPYSCRAVEIASLLLDIIASSIWSDTLFKFNDTLTDLSTFRRSTLGVARVAHFPLSLSLKGKKNLCHLSLSVRFSIRESSLKRPMRSFESVPISITGNNCIYNSDCDQSRNSPRYFFLLSLEDRLVVIF